MNKGIAFAGNLIADNIKHIESYPGAHQLTTIREVKRATGGLVCNCAIDIARLDGTVPVKAVGIVGCDEAGDFILKEMGKYPSIDTSRIMRDGITSYTDVMTEPDGGRTFFQYRGANALLTPGYFDLASLDADILHIGYILLLDGLDKEDSEYPTALCRVLDGAQKSDIRTSIDVVSEDSERFSKLVPPALGYTDYCIINEIEASKTTGIPLRDDAGNVIEQNLAYACRALMGMGVKRWAVIHMPEMSCGMDSCGLFIRQDSWRIPDGFKKSSVGAGDAFASGVLYGAYRDWSLEKAIHTAGAVAAYSLSGNGACDSICALDELLDAMKSFQ